METCLLYTLHITKLLLGIYESFQYQLFMRVSFHVSKCLFALKWIKREVKKKPKGSRDNYMFNDWLDTEACLFTCTAYYTNIICHL